MQPSPSPSIVSGISQGTQEKMSHQILIFLLDLLNFINIFFNLFSRFHWLFFLFIRLTALQNGNVGFTRQTHAIVRALQKCRMHYACGENIAKLLVHVSHSRTFDTHIPYKYISIMHMRQLYPAISIYTKASARSWKIHEKKFVTPSLRCHASPAAIKRKLIPRKSPADIGPSRWNQRDDESREAEKKSYIYLYTRSWTKWIASRCDGAARRRSSLERGRRGRLSAQERWSPRRVESEHKGV